ncbi:MAG: hypothetical protein NC037_06590 [Bacteroides sp.]|nr:hypothetical protein [Bacillota bacterium]MCM1394424.1 hypothetical protein [[Eubacterium] siraeum]MCM1456172.1 hypothetical protein [Bacteroides sp.]
MGNLIKSGKLFMLIGAGLFIVDSLVAIFGLVGHFFVVLAFILSIAMFVLAFFSKKHIAVDIVYLVLTALSLIFIMYVAAQYQKDTYLRPTALAVGILCYIEGALSIVGGILAIVYLTKGYGDYGGSYGSNGFKRALRRFGEWLGNIGGWFSRLFSGRSRSSRGHRRRHYSHNSALKEFFDSDTFRTIFAAVLAGGSIVYCIVSLCLHRVWFDVLTGIPIALTFATVGNLLLTIKNEYLSSYDEVLWKNVVGLIVVIAYHALFILATVTSFLVFNYNENISPFIAALNLSFGVIAVAQPFIFDRLEDEDLEWLSTFSFPAFYGALYVVNMGICCLEAYSIHSPWIMARIFAGIVMGATLVFGVIRIIVCIKDIAVTGGRAVIDKLTPQSVKESREMERKFKINERKEHPQFFNCAKLLKSRFYDAAKEIIKTHVEVRVSSNERDCYGSDYNDLRLKVHATMWKYLPLELDFYKKKEIKQEYADKLQEYFAAIVSNTKAGTGYTGTVSFDLSVD